MSVHNDYSIVNCTTYKGSTFTSILTGNGLDTFQGQALSTIEYIVRNSGFPDYTLGTVGGTSTTFENNQLFYDVLATQTDAPSEALLLLFLMGDATVSTGGSVPAAGAQTTLITTLAAKSFILYSKSSKPLDSTATAVTCDTNGNGRFQICQDQCVYKTQVTIF